MQHYLRRLTNLESAQLNFAGRFAVCAATLIGISMAGQHCFALELNYPMPSRADFLPVETVTPDPEGKALYGPEFTFAIGMHAGHATSYNRDELISRMKSHLVDNQPEGAKFTKDAGRFTSPNGWSFDVKLDHGVIEVTMTPMNLDSFTKFASDIQDAIFVSAANVDLYPALFMGGGHLSISMARFKYKPMLFRNFIVDFLNHNELALGVMSFDANNAVSPSLMKAETIRSLAEKIKIFDEGMTQSNWDAGVAVDFLLREVETLFVNDKSEYRQAFIKKDSKTGKANNKFTAMNLMTTGLNLGRSRIEMRAIRPQASFDVFLRQVRLFEKRIAYLESLKDPLELKPKVAIIAVENPSSTAQLTPPVDPQQALQAFYEYVTEIGEKISDHTDYLWPQWITNGEVTKFENSDWFKQRASCAGLLTR